MCSDYLPRPTRRIERTTRPLDVALPSYAAIAAVITATNSASSERSGPVTAGAAATGLTAGAAAFGVGAGASAGEKKNGGGGGLGGKMTPSAVLVIKNGSTKLVNVRNQDAMTKVLDMIPDIVDKFTTKKDEMIPDDKAVDIAFPEEENQ